MSDIEERVVKIMSAVFGLQFDEVGDDTSMEALESWDSLMHINLMLAIEEEFNIYFNDTEMAELINYKSIIQRLSKESL